MKKHTLLAAVLVVAAVVVILLMPPEQTLGNNIRLVYIHAAIAEAAIVFFVLAAVTALTSMVFPSVGSWARPLFSGALRLWAAQVLLGALNMKIIWGAFLWTEPKVRIGLVLFLVALGTEILLEVSYSTVLRLAGYVVSGLMAVYTLVFTSDVFHPRNAILGGTSPLLKSLFLLLSVTVLALACLWVGRRRARALAASAPVNPASS